MYIFLWLICRPHSTSCYKTVLYSSIILVSKSSSYILVFLTYDIDPSLKYCSRSRSINLGDKLSKSVSVCVVRWCFDFDCSLFNAFYTSSLHILALKSVISTSPTNFRLTLVDQEWETYF